MDYSPDVLEVQQSIWIEESIMNLHYQQYRIYKHENIR